MKKLELTKDGGLFTVRNGSVIFPKKEKITEYAKMLGLPCFWFFDVFDFFRDLAKRLDYDSYAEMLLAFKELPNGVYSVRVKNEKN